MLVLLVVALALVPLATRAALARAGEPRGSLVAAGTLAMLAVLPELLGRPFSSLPVGLALTALMLAAPALLHLRALRRSGAWSARVERAWPERLALAALFGLGAWTALSTFLWDEGSTHFGLSAALARGVLPPEHPLFPGEPFHYHYGYDVLVALLLRSLPLPQALACDVVTLACLAVLALVLADAGRALAGARGAWLAVLVVPLGYGPAAALLADGWGAALPGIAALPRAWVSAPRLPPPVIASFFQHPQGLGMPIALAALLVVGAPTAPPSRAEARARWLCSSFLLALLALAQTVFFVLSGLALGVLALASAARARRWGELGALVPLAFAALFGGALAPLVGGVGGADLLWHGYFDDAPLPLLARHLLLFGGSLLAAPLALLRWRAPHTALRVALVVAAGAGFLVPNLLSYARSWDVVKFFAVGAFFGNLLLADLLATLLQAREPPGAQGRAVGRTLLAALGLAALVLCTWSGALWLLRHGPLNGVVAARYTERPPDALAVKLARAFGEAIGARERVLTTHPELFQAGFLVEGADWRQGGQGYRLDRAERDRAHAAAERALHSGRGAELLDTGADWLFTRTPPAADAPVTRVGELEGFTLYRIEREP